MHRICVFTGSNFGNRPEYRILLVRLARNWQSVDWGWFTAGPAWV